MAIIRNFNGGPGRCKTGTSRPGAVLYYDFASEAKTGPMQLILRFLWDLTVGPLLSLLPERWRRRLPEGLELDWGRAATLSGLYQLIAAAVAFGYWYMLEVPSRIGQILDATTDGRIPVGMTEHQVQGAALTFFYLNPLTWLLLYFFLEGALRLCGAAFTGNLLGTLPLYLTERAMFWIRHPREAHVGATVKETASSIAESVRERVMVAGLPEVVDALQYSKEGEEEWLEIRASRRKLEWLEPKIVRVDDTYYRLEESRVGKGPRPFSYRLRRLPAGVPGRSVILYRTSAGQQR